MTGSTCKNQRPISTTIVTYELLSQRNIDNPTPRRKRIHVAPSSTCRRALHTHTRGAGTPRVCPRVHRGFPSHPDLYLSDSIVSSYISTLYIDATQLSTRRAQSQGPHFSVGVLPPFPNFLLFLSIYSTLRQYREPLSCWESGLPPAP